MKNIEPFKYTMLILILLFGAKLFAGTTQEVAVLSGNEIQSSATISLNQNAIVPSSINQVFYIAKLIYGREKSTDVTTLTPSLWTLAIEYELIENGQSISTNELSIDNETKFIDAQYLSSLTNGSSDITLNIVGYTATGSIPSDVHLELVREVVSTKQVTSQIQLIENELVGDKQMLRWNFVPGAEEYEIEYIFIDEKDKNHGSINSTTAFDHHDISSTTITRGRHYKEPINVITTETYLEIDLVYPKGTIFYRVRPIGIFNTTKNTPYFGEWTLPNSFALDGFETEKTWQKVTTYAEDAKKKNVVTYYDGSNRGRQTLTDLSTSDNVLIAESIYDFEGRASLSILPTVLPKNNLRFHPLLNLNSSLQSYSRLDFDKLDQNSATALNIDSGAARYYSNQNNVGSINRGYIPNANGYVFTQTEYLRDGTGRVKRTSGIGEKFKFGSGKETKMFYLGTNESELHRLFGSNVGDFKHYKKNMVKDPNGQLSVTYLDQEGRTIATSLIGLAPDNLEPIPTGFPNITAQLSSVIDTNQRTSTRVYKFANPVANTSYEFSYNLTGAINSINIDNPEISICKSCVYDLEIYVTNPDGEKIPFLVLENGAYTNIGLSDVNDSPSKINMYTDEQKIFKKTFSASSVDCQNTNFQNSIVNFTLKLEELGDFKVVKTLKISDESLDALIDGLNIDPQSSTVYQEIESQYTSDLDYSLCALNCEQQCLEQQILEYIETFQGPKPTHQEAVDYFNANPNLINTDCIESCVNEAMDDAILNVETTLCESKLNRMKEQIAYGGVLNTDDAWWARCYSILIDIATYQYHFYYHNSNSTNVFDVNDYSYKPFKRFFLDQDLWQLYFSGTTNSPANTFNPTNANGSFLPFWNAVTTTSGTTTNARDIDPLLIDALVLFHPEYCHYENCVDNINSRIFDDHLTIVKTATDALLPKDLTFLDAQGQPITLNGVLFTDGPNVSNPVIDYKHLMTIDPYFENVSNLLTHPFYNGSSWSLTNYKERYPGTATQASSGFFDIWQYYNIDEPLNPFAPSDPNYLSTTDIYYNDDSGTIPSAPLATGSNEAYDRHWSLYRNAYKEIKAKYIYEQTLSNATILINNNNTTFFPTNLTSNSIWNTTDLIVENQATCAFIDNETAIFEDPYPMGFNELTDGDDDEITFIQNHLEQNYDDICQGRVEAVKYMLMSNCPALTGSYYDSNIAHLILDYCNQSVGLNNPLGVIFQQEFQDAMNGVPGANPTLVTIFNLLNNLTTITNGDECFTALTTDESDYEPVLDDNGNPIMTEGYTIQVINPCFIDYIDILNDLCLQDNTIGSLGNTNGINPISYTNGSQILECFCPGYYLPNSPGKFTIYEKIHPNSPNPFNNQISFIYEQTNQSGNSTGGTMGSFIEIFDETGMPYPVSNVHSINNVHLHQINQAPFNPSSASNNTTIELLASVFTTSGNTEDVVLLISFNNDCAIGNLIQDKVIGSTEIWLPKPKPGLPDNPLEILQLQCWEQLEAQATHYALEEYEEYLAGAFTAAIDKSVENCMKFTEDFTVNYKLQEHHYTLYYYDQAGNLTQTVPPEGVKPLDVSNNSNFTSKGVYISGEPNHGLKTQYHYNTLNQLVWQSTPDGGESRFWYDHKGQLKASQNAQQSEENKFSYTLYDNLGRIKEVGELVSDLTFSSTDFYKEIDLLVNDNASNFPQNLHSNNMPILAQRTMTYYGDEDLNTLINPSWQKNLRGRVALVTNTDENNVPISETRYNYDEHGNVSTLKQNVLGYAEKTIDYEYDLLSGNVNKVFYQKGAQDQFIHKYEYDADNRITNVYTSRDNMLWDQEAEYFYYAHGPLARVEIGEDKVQSLDYYYTLQGWLKGINTPNNENLLDPGKDGEQLANNLNSKNGVDEFALALGYFENDYEPINNSINLGAAQDPWAAFKTNMHYDVKSTSSIEQIAPAGKGGLFNGNIAWQMTNIAPQLKETVDEFEGGQLAANVYRYDQLNRIKSSRSYIYDISDWQSRTSLEGDLSISNFDMNHFDASYNYDANGNIISLQRSAKGLSVFDQLKYNYYHETINDITSPLINNKLRAVNDDPIFSAVSSSDIDDHTDFNISNSLSDYYKYDKIGNLIYDKSEEIAEIRWTVYGKVAKVIRENTSDKANIQYLYDAMGNRIAKYVIGKQNVAGSTTEYEEVPESEWVKTYYMRDASGNILASYINNVNNSPPTNDVEYAIYGSSRLGTNAYDQEQLNVYESSTSQESITKPYTLSTDRLIDYDPNVGITVGSTVTLNSGETIVIDQITGGQSFPGYSVIECIATSVVTTAEINNARLVGLKKYELSNHLGNVMVVVSDKRKGQETGTPDGIADYYLADVVSAQDYYPFGSTVPGRKYSVGSKYRYGFQNQEEDEETGLVNYKFRMHDPRLGRFFATDPLESSFPWNSPYAFSENMVIHAVELEGLEAHVLSQTFDGEGNLMNSSFTWDENAEPVDNGQLHYIETIVTDISTTTTNTVKNVNDINYQGGNLLPTPAPPSVMGTTDYYTFRDNDFNIRQTLMDKWYTWQPNSPDYYLEYGDKYVNKFSNELYPKLSSAGQEWLEGALINLQNAIEIELNINPNIEVNNKAFSRYAFDSHVDAYENAGLFNLPINDLLLIGTTPDALDLLSPNGIKQVKQVAGDYMQDAKNRPVYTGFRILEFSWNIYKSMKKEKE